MYSEPEKESQPPAGTSASETEQKLTPGNADIMENKSDTFWVQVGCWQTRQH